MKIFRKIGKLTSWIFCSKCQRLCYKDFCAALDLKKNIVSVHENYKKVKEKLKNKTDKIKVVFLIRENQKWSYQSVYEAFEKDEKFEPLILVSLLEIARKGKDKTRNNIEESYDFFKSRGMNVDYAYKNGEYVNFKEFSPDIIFYDQPWDLPFIHHPEYVSDFALTFYTSYSYELVDTPEDYTQDFHRFLYRFFVEDELNIKRYGLYNKENVENCVAVGYPKLDEYFKSQNESDIWKEENKLKAIYAPHHSIEKNGLRLSTFKQNGRFILELAKKHPETTWIFKPHSRFKYALLRTKTMTEEEVDEYYNEWAKIGAVYEQGDYINLFRTSDLMITDGCSFLAEYLPTQNPLIRLINKKSIPLNELGKKLTEGYYEAKNNYEIEKYFCDIINNIDAKKKARKVLVDMVMDPKEKSGMKIYNHILKTLEEG